MYWVVAGTLNVIVTEGVWWLLNDACELESISGNNLKSFEKYALQFIQNNWMEMMLFLSW